MGSCLSSPRRRVHPIADFSEDQDDLEPDCPISDLVLVVHGIGEKKFQLVASNCSELRVSCQMLMEKLYPEEKRRPMIKPVEWRSSLLMDEDKVKKITLPRAAGIRENLNSVAMDIIYYQSPRFRIDIVKGVARCLNETYEKFMEENPGFNGSVHIIAHSLGSVVVYDILTQWTPFRLYEEYVEKALVNYRKVACPSKEECRAIDTFRDGARGLFKQDALLQRILVAQEGSLKFKVKNLFCVGSPVSVYSIMRGASFEDILPPKEKLERLFNIFHPADPVAYRLEPLFHEDYRHFTPVKIRVSGEGRVAYNGLSFALRSAYRKKMKKTHLSTTKPEEKADREVIISEIGATVKKPDCDESNSDSEENSSPLDETIGLDGSFSPTSSTSMVNGKMEKLVSVASVLDGVPMGRRITQRYDFQLEPAFEEKLIEYLAVFRGHFIYWSNFDFAAFLLNALYEPSVAEEGMDDEEKRKKMAEEPTTQR